MLRYLALLIFAALVLASCDDAPTPAEPDPEPDPEPSPVTVDGSAGAIFRTLVVSLDSAMPLQVDYWATGTPRLRVTSALDTSEHRIFLPRLRAETTYQYEIRTPGSTNGPSLFTGELDTDSLPTVFSAIGFEASGAPTFPLLMVEVRFPTWRQVIVDREGQIVWYRPADDMPRSTGFTRLANGDFVFNEEHSLAVVTPDLRTVARLDRTAEMGQMHHDVITTPQNTVLFLAQEDRVVDGTEWTGEAIWEWDPATGELAQRWSSFDYLDPAVDQGDRSVPRDWLHANSLAIGPRGNVLVSLFWLHEVLSIAPGYQELEWRLGGPGSTFEVLEGAMDAGQHTAAEVSSGRVLLFDNGRDRPDSSFFSRASEIELDHAAGTAALVWQFRPEPDIYAPIMSSARRLENGHTVVTFGTAEGFVESSGPIAIFEVTPSSQVVWSLRVEEVRGVYRATPLTHIGHEMEVAPSPP